MKYEYIFDRESCWFKQNCENYKNAEICSQFCKRYKYLHYHANHSLMTNKQLYPEKLSIPEIDEQAYERLSNIRKDIFNYVQSGNNLLLKSSKCGNGKTTWTTKLAMTYMSKLRTNDYPRVLFINVARLCVWIKQMFAGYVHKDLHYFLDNVETADLVIWDDVAVVELTNSDYISLYTYIDYRILAGKSNFYTINAKEKDLMNILGERLYSRIVLDSEVLEFKSEDCRCKG